MYIVFENPFRGSGAGLVKITEEVESGFVDMTPGLPFSEAAPELQELIWPLFRL